MAVLQRGVGTGVHLDIYSDVICPWCYLGSRRVAAALERFGDLHADEPVTLRWRAYELDPGAPAEARPMRPVIERKYGPGAFDSMAERLTALGGPEGIDYRFDLALRVNTLDAHRLLAWALAAGSAEQGVLSERLFRAYFSEGANVADQATLADLAGQAGLDAAEAAEVLATGAFAGEVQADLDTARDRDILGVPNFVIESRLSIPGAQEVETMVLLLQRARERLTAGA